jgi:hypothetical protein
MGFADQKYYARPMNDVVHALGAGTATASATDGGNVQYANGAATAILPFERRTAIQKVRVMVVTAPSTNVTGIALSFVANNSAGTAIGTFGKATVGATAAGTFIDAVAVGSVGGSAVTSTETNLFTPYKTSTLPNAQTVVVMQGTQTNAIVPKDGYVTIFVTGTATASGASQNLGTYSIYWEPTELFDSQIRP